MMRSVQIRAADIADWPAIVDVLACCGLPIEAVDQALRSFHIALLGDCIVGCASAELYGDTVVVRSVAVLQEYRGHQIATRLVGSVLMLALTAGCTKAVLVTAGRLGLAIHRGDALKGEEPLPEEVDLTQKLVNRFRHCKAIKISLC